MEGVGARLGRSSTRYGPSSTVFNGPVRKWKKKWVHASPSRTNASSDYHSQTSGRNGSIANVRNGSHLLLYKWTPITQSEISNGGSAGEKSSAGDDDAADSALEEPPRRKFKFIPIAVLEEQSDEAVENEAAEEVDYEAKSIDTDSSAPDLISRNDGSVGKPDINNVPMEEKQASGDTGLARQDLNISNLDLSLGLKAHDGDPNSDVEADKSIDSH